MYLSIESTSGLVYTYLHVYIYTAHYVSTDYWPGGLPDLSK